MANYDKIAKQWHAMTGYKGGPLKELVLNDILLDRIGSIAGRSLLEIGAGNGYFMPMVIRRYSGQTPSSIIVTDQSTAMLEIAKKNFRIQNADYRLMDAGLRFPLEDGSVDLILATMVFNEMPIGGLKNALVECHRVLSNSGVLLATVTHPDFVSDLQKRGMIKKTGGTLATMPGSGSLRLPVALRRTDEYRKALADSGFRFQEESIYPSNKVVNARPGLRNTHGLPLALLFKCNKPSNAISNLTIGSHQSS